MAAFPVKSVGVVGGGVVGTAVARSYWHDCEVRVYDLLIDRRTHNLNDVLSCDLIFLCLPTPEGQSGKCNTSAIDQFFLEIPVMRFDANFVLRSTVPIGYTAELAKRHELPNIVHSPEFLTARTAEHDANHPRLNVIGFPGYLSGDSIGSSNAASKLWSLYRARFPNVPLRCMSSNESEAVKIGMNGFFAVKVAYWNEVSLLFREKGCDYRTVIDAILADGRVHPLHTMVPGPDGKYGYGGSCFPKDIASLVEQLGEYGMVANAAMRRNIAVDRKRAN